MDIHPFMPLLANIHHFETELCEYAQKHRHAACLSGSEQRSRAQDLQQGMSMAWLSTLFALLACGTQLSYETISIRQERSSLYGQ
jgi:hypothetical protein